jgi:5,5'-dehydrodivanillate O-demethylase
MLKHTLRLPAYPVQKVRGLIFAYLGPLPAPMIPPWDVVAREDGTHALAVHPLLEANWLQVQETNLDPTHNTFLHQKMKAAVEGRLDSWKFRPIEEMDFEICDWGIVKRRQYGGEAPFREEGHPALFPNILRHSAPESNGIDLYWRTPVDDTHTQSFWLGFKPSPDGSVVEEAEDPPVTYVVMKDENGDFHMRSNPSQDTMAWETQGPLRDRSIEQLGASDKGVVMWRQLLKEQIEKVKRGEDPIGVIREPNKYRIISFSMLK